MKKNTFSLPILSLTLFSLVLIGGSCNQNNNSEAQNLPINPDPSSEKTTSEPITEEEGMNKTPGTTNPSVHILIEDDLDAPLENTVKEFTMTAKKWDFEPSNITVNKGDTVKLSITSIDIDHGFAISQFGINTMLEPGKTEVVEFIADKAGTFSFFCSVFCGSGHGTMKGTLTVN